MSHTKKKKKRSAGRDPEPRQELKRRAKAPIYGKGIIPKLIYPGLIVAHMTMSIREVGKRCVFSHFLNGLVKPNPNFWLTTKVVQAQKVYRK